MGVARRPLLMSSWATLTRKSKREMFYSTEIVYLTRTLGNALVREYSFPSNILRPFLDSKLVTSCVSQLPVSEEKRQPREPISGRN